MSYFGEMVEWPPPRMAGGPAQREKRRFAMFYVYILVSLKTGKHYIGCTRDHMIRLSYHNNGRVRSTKNGVPWKIIYIEKFPTKREAYKREQKIKKMKGGIQFKELLKHGEVAEWPKAAVC